MKHCNVSYDNKYINGKYTIISKINYIRNKFLKISGP
jgi:hypothetical protein